MNKTNAMVDCGADIRILNRNNVAPWSVATIGVRNEFPELNPNNEVSDVTLT